MTDASSPHACRHVTQRLTTQLEAQLSPLQVVVDFDWLAELVQVLQAAQSSVEVHRQAVEAGDVGAEMDERERGRVREADRKRGVAAAAGREGGGEGSSLGAGGSGQGEREREREGYLSLQAQMREFSVRVMSRRLPRSYRSVPRLTADLGDIHLLLPCYNAVSREDIHLMLLCCQEARWCLTSVRQLDWWAHTVVVLSWKERQYLLPQRGMECACLFRPS